MLKSTLTFHPSTIIKKSQTHYTNFPKIHITNNKPLHISSCRIDAADANFVLKAEPVLKAVPGWKDQSNSLSINGKLHVPAFEAVFSTVKRVFSSVVKLVSSQFIVEEDSLVVVNDLISFKHNGMEVIGEVQHVVHHDDGLMETTLLCEHGLKEFSISIYDIYNLTVVDEKDKDKMWRIYISLECEECEDDYLEEMVVEIKDILNAHDYLKCNSKYNSVVVNPIYLKKKIMVICFITCSKLETPHFEHYMEVRKKLLSEINEIRRKHGSKEESALGDR